MNQKFKLALVEEIAKLANLPGALSSTQPYGMTQGVRQALAIVGKTQRGLPGMVGTMSIGAGPGTVGGGVPKGMGEHEDAKTRPLSSSKIGAALLSMPNLKPFFGGPTSIKNNILPPPRPPGMGIPKTTIASAYPGPADALRALGAGPELDGMALTSKEGSRTRLLGVLEALDGLLEAKTAADMAPALMRLAELRKEAQAGHALRSAGGMGSRMRRNKAFWTLASK